MAKLSNSSTPLLWCAWKPNPAHLPVPGACIAYLKNPLNIMDHIRSHNAIRESDKNSPLAHEENCRVSGFVGFGGTKIQKASLLALERRRPPGATPFWASNFCRMFPWKKHLPRVRTCRTPWLAPSSPGPRCSVSSPPSAQRGPGSRAAAGNRRSHRGVVRACECECSVAPSIRL